MKLRKNPGIVEQVRTALRREHRLATFVGAMLGAIVPASTFTLAHAEVTGDVTWRNALLVALIAGGLLYSALTVYRWGRLAFGSGAKAIGFTVLLEGVMTCSEQTWLAGLALAYLCGINAIATGVTLARGEPEQTKGVNDDSRQARDVSARRRAPRERP